MSKTLNIVKKRKLKIILWDIETLPDLDEVMKVFSGLSAYPGLTLKATINSIICVGWKEYGKKKVHCINAWDYKNWKKDVNDDYEVVKAAFEVLKDADVVVTHNGKSFDWKFLQTRLVYHGFKPLPKIIHVDTKTESKRHFFSFNNRLNTLAKFFTEQTKKQHNGWDLWVDVRLRDPKAMKTMTEYCKQDVRVLEQMFEVVKPLVTSLPNANIFTGTCNSCPNCGSTRLHRRGEHVTKNYRRARYHCRECGTWSLEGKDHPVKV
jgi:DNA polymerase elongation subunit (family B)